MNPVNVGYVFLFVKLQCQLMRVFAEIYPGLKDFQWLLDFPRSGEVLVGCDRWGFVKHGAGLRFERVVREPHWIVDIHEHVDKSKLIDSWRVLKFFKSCGESVDEVQVLSMLSEMCSEGYLRFTGPGQYLLID
ncbi:DUF6896 domain-containing protein [Metapseudomonas otitidis]|uniref:DUF6896 domain-containing protein n=1 Tax=Metapseudomonas otitidis TaxID=319939 RepID=UPI00244CBFEA|nr:hypothetical protein [Pseudomonas otitidis]MDH0339727.1 hypothetical protein [Pseudomonas otitidis]